MMLIEDGRSSTMVKTRSSARVGGATAADIIDDNGPLSELSKRLKAAQNGVARNHRGYDSRTNNQAMGSVGAGSGAPGGGGGQGNDPLAPALPQSSRALYQHPAVTGAYTHHTDSRGQVMPGRQNSLYASSVYHGYGPTGGNVGSLAPVPQPSPSAPIQPYPVHPDVRFKRLPFYDILAELMKPSSLVPTTTNRMQEAPFFFHLTPQQATDISTSRDVVGVGNKLDFTIQVQLRFCLLETSCEQEDFFPPNVSVKINNKLCPLPNPIPTNKPGVEPKRPPRPVNITSMVKLSPTLANHIHVTWASDYTRGYALSVFMVKKLTYSELLQRLKNKGTKNPDYTRSLIKEKLAEDYDCEIATTSLRVSLVCPLGKMRMVCPCRPAVCPHLQCFDASLFLQMNEKKPTWLCPVCDRPAPYDSLVVDGYFQDVLISPRLTRECNEIQLHKDGTWSAHTAPARPAAPVSPRRPDDTPVTLISDDLEVIPLEGHSAKKIAVGENRTPKPATPAPDVQMVDLTSDSEDELPLKRKVPLAASPTPAHHEDNYSSNNGAEAVSSSGYRSPTGAGGAVISLDSPSPPAPASPAPGSPTSASANAVDPLPEQPHVSITPVEACGSSTVNEAAAAEDPSSHWPAYAEADATEAQVPYRRY